MNGARKVFAIEPESNNYELLKKNIALNNLEGKVIPIKAGASNRSGVCPIHGHPRLNSGQKSLMYNNKFPVIEYVPVISFHNLIEDILQLTEEESNGVIDYLKMDVEGEEFRILSGENSLKKVDYICIDIHSLANTDYFPVNSVNILEEGIITTPENSTRDLIDHLISQGFKIVRRVESKGNWYEGAFHLQRDKRW